LDYEDSPLFGSTVLDEGKGFVQVDLLLSNTAAVKYHTVIMLFKETKNPAVAFYDLVDP
jgi:hypothetical protein